MSQESIKSLLLSPRIGTGALARLCHRLSTSLEAGVDVRTVCAREADHAVGLSARSRFRAISDAVNDGDGLAEAINQTGDYFPGLFREMTLVGEKTGHLGEIFAKLAGHYDVQLRRRQIFLAAIAWPMIELVIAVGVIGLFILILGMIGDADTIPDPLGFGIGTPGLIRYTIFVVAVTAAVAFVVYAVQRGVVWTQPIQRAVLRIPALGKALETICLARVAWSLHLTLGAGIDVRQAMRLSLTSARNARFTGQMESIDEAISSGGSIYEAFYQAGDYPPEFLDCIQVGEQSGNLAESMATLSRQYHERADAAMKVFTMLAGLLVLLVVFAIIITLIFRIFIIFYLGPMNEAQEMLGM